MDLCARADLARHRVMRAMATGEWSFMANQIWEFKEFPGPSPSGESNAVIFLNDPDRQGRGEASAALRGDGSVGLFYLVPGSLGGGTSPTWAYQDFPGPNGAKDAVIFLNAPDRQGRGEATATLRSDGTAGLLYLEPGSLGTSTTHTWEYGEFVGPKQAVDFLNDPARQGRGEATVTPRKDGTVGLLYLSPGSLGISTTHTWYYKEYPAPHGVRDALTFLNAHPRQGEGEVSGYARSDGSAVIFYLEPGSN
jgi:hypothetical protein